ncbi:Dual specificity protein kinase CLK3, partial [Ophiophagus hannah]
MLAGTRRGRKLIPSRDAWVSNLSCWLFQSTSPAKERKPSPSPGKRPHGPYRTAKLRGRSPLRRTVSAPRHSLLASLGVAGRAPADRGPSYQAGPEEKSVEAALPISAGRTSHVRVPDFGGRAQRPAGQRQWLVQPPQRAQQRGGAPHPRGQRTGVGRRRHSVREGGRENRQLAKCWKDWPSSSATSDS